MFVLFVSQLLCIFVADLNKINMKKVFVTFICGGLLLLVPLYSRAESYKLQCCLVSSNHKNLGGGRTAKNSLVVDLIDHTLAVPSQVVGFTLILESMNGDTYIYSQVGTIFQIPHEMGGVFKLVLRNDDMVYEGFIKIVN